MKLVLSLAAGLILTATMAVAQMPPSTGNSTTPAAPPAGMPGSAQTATSARTQIEASGYTNIKDLKRRDDGSWQATATKNDTEVAVSVDTSGSVTQISR
ncbi:PepSY domain-containing protein [Reyranella sp.]|uniref:PepSY domain-containing protein n=1 Tax=Reyranella sp. TaxID=1929291 RepID=UPI003C7ED50D